MTVKPRAARTLRTLTATLIACSLGAWAAAAQAASEPPIESTPPPPELADVGPIDLASADEVTLTNLPGIGPKKARAIVEHRARHPFTKIADLRKVKGIGAATLKRLRPHLRLSVDAGRGADKKKKGPARPGGR